MPGIAEHLLGDDGAVEDGAERHGKPGDLRHQRVAHDVGAEDAAPVDAGELGVDDVVLAHDVGDQRAHAEKPAAEPDQHQRQRRQDRMLEDAQDEGRVEALLDVHAVAAGDRQQRPQVAEHHEQHEGDDVVGHGMQTHGDDGKHLQARACPGSSRRGRRAGCRASR